MQNRLMEVRAIFEGHLETLRKQAHESAIRFEDYTVKENSRRDKWKDQNTLKFRVRLAVRGLDCHWFAQQLDNRVDEMAPKFKHRTATIPC